MLSAATIWSLAACGGGSDATSPPASEVAASDRAPVTSAIDATNTVATEVPTNTQPAVTEPADTLAPTDRIPERGTTPFDGPAFIELTNARMDELAATFGLPATPESVASIFELPLDFPYPVGVITGVFHEYSFDDRFSEEFPIDEERHVGIDAPGDAAALDSVLASVDADAETRWERNSSQRDAFINDLYTALPLDGGEFKDRLVVRGVETPDPGEPSLQVRLEQLTTEIPVPTWKASLPTLEGGVLTDVREGRGVVESFGNVPQGGYIEMREFYEVDRLAELEAFFASGIIESAGFEYEDTPFNNFSIRIDISAGDWVGTVGVGEIVIGDELAGYQLIWSLTRAE